MATVIRYTGLVVGYLDFYMVDERIMCENTIDQLTTQELWDAIVDTEDEQLAFGYEGIAVADGKNPAINSALNVTLLRNWRIGTEKVNGSFKLIGGNATSETLGTEPFEPNPLVFMTNQLSQFGTTIAVGTGLNAQQVLMLTELYEAHYHRREHDGVANTITIYEADNTTPKKVFDTNADLSDITPQ